MLNLKLLEILVCPNCHHALVYHKTTNELICRQDNLAYPIENDIPIMLQARARKITMEE